MFKSRLEGRGLSLKSGWFVMCAQGVDRSAPVHTIQRQTSPSKLNSACHHHVERPYPRGQSGRKRGKTRALHLSSSSPPNPLSYPGPHRTL